MRCWAILIPGKTHIYVHTHSYNHVLPQEEMRLVLELLILWSHICHAEMHYNLVMNPLKNHSMHIEVVSCLANHPAQDCFNTNLNECFKVM